VVEFSITWMTESGGVRTDTGRAPMEKINTWNAEIRRAVEESDAVATISVPHLDGDSDWAGDKIRAILVKEVTPLAVRPDGW
jgi:hypothetical protein